MSEKADVEPKYIANTLLLVAIAIFLAGCERRPDVILGHMLQAEGLDDFQRYAGQARALEEDGIPLFLTVIEASLATPYSVFSYGKTNTCLNHLHDLASEGIYTVEEVPTLLRTINEQIAIMDTLVTAEILEMITGIDVGYDEEFVSSYTPSDEAKRERMISDWHRWYEAASE